MNTGELLDDHFEELTIATWSDLGSANTIHDRLQFQSTFDFDLKAHGEETKRSYEIDTYLFIPRSVGLNEGLYTRDQFYASLTNYYRVRTPSLIAGGTLQPDKWRIVPADQYFAVHLITHQRQELAPLVVQEVKLFGCFINTQLKRIHSYMVRLLRRRPAGLGHRLSTLEKHLRNLIGILKRYRQLYMDKVQYQRYLVDPEVKQVFLLVDEYISYRLESMLITYHQLLDSSQLEVKGFTTLLSETLTEEMGYRSRENLILLTDQSPESEQESYYYRLSLLKKYVSDVLFLQVRNIRKDRVYRNLVAMTGAALAATWAGLIDLQRIYWMQHENANDFALRFFLFVILGVIAYIFKDRIKESTREYFNERLKQYLPDFDYQLVFPFYNTTQRIQEERTIGTSREYMRYLRRDSLPPEVHYIRELGHQASVDPERMEEVIHYSKRITLDLRTTRDQLEHVHYIKDIVRFSISEFLEKLDDPNKNLRYFAPERGISMIKAPKVYHLNVIFRYAVSEELNGRNTPRRVEFERMRIVFNKHGILRIEPSLPRGTFSYREEEL